MSTLGRSKVRFQHLGAHLLAVSLAACGEGWIPDTCHLSRAEASQKICEVSPAALRPLEIVKADILSEPTTLLTQDTLAVQLTLSEVVHVEGELKIPTSVGPMADAHLRYVSGSGTDTLVFEMPIEAAAHTLSIQTRDITWAATENAVLWSLGRKVEALQLSRLNEVLVSVRVNPDLLKTVDAGDAHVCTVREDAEVACWGSNASGQIGQGTSPSVDDPQTVDFQSAGKAVSIAAGGAHTCLLFESGEVRCWGANDKGQLGLGHTQNRGNSEGDLAVLPAVDLGASAKAISVVAGGEHSCALLSDSRVKCWGANESGQLGLGDTQHRGDAGEMGDALAFIDLGENRKAIALSAGEDHTCALLDNRQVKCWGANKAGQLGQGDSTSYGSAPNTMGDALTAIDLGDGRKAVSVTAGGNSTCVLTQEGQSLCFGDNGFGQLGLGDTEGRGTSKDHTGDALQAISLTPARDFVSADLGAAHTCLLSDTAEALCLGANAIGQLGQGNFQSIGHTPESLLGLAPMDLAGDVYRVVAGGDTSCALLSTGQLQCFGDIEVGTTAVRRY